MLIEGCGNDRVRPKDKGASSRRASKSRLAAIWENGCPRLDFVGLQFGNWRPIPVGRERAPIRPRPVIAAWFPICLNGETPRSCSHHEEKAHSILFCNLQAADSADELANIGNGIAGIARLDGRAECGELREIGGGGVIGVDVPSESRAYER